MRLPCFTCLCLLTLPMAAHADDIITVTVQGTLSASYTGIDQLNPDNPAPITITGNPPESVSGTASLDITTLALSNFTLPTAFSFDSTHTDTLSLPSEVSSDCSYNPSDYTVAVACFSGNGVGEGTIFSYDAVPASIPIGGDDTMGRITYELDGSFAPQATSAVTPEPSTIALFGSGLLGLSGLLRRRPA